MIFLRIVDIIIKKKEGYSLTNEEIEYVINGYVNGKIPDYQISALLMAICFQGLNQDEQLSLTKAMLESGEQIDLSRLNGMCVDKHSTGGVGDKTTLVFAPIIASCGLKIAKMSGRGLGHTGGTLDKLESIPNFTITLSSEEFLKQVNDISIAVIGQSANITPADKKLYALRDVTGTVDSIGLIASSIMSKKLASGAKCILLDVKVGKGAFMKTPEEAKKLARAMVDIGNGFGRKTVAVLTNMEEPLGMMVGNSLEVIEAIETLKGHGTETFNKLCETLATEMLLMTGVSHTQEEALSLIKQKIQNHEALEKLKEMIIYQKGNPNVIDDYSLLPLAKKEIPVKATKSGYVKELDALKIGLSAMLLGSGRENKDDIIDLGVGIKLNKKVGDYVNQGEELLVLYSNGKNEDEAYTKALSAYEIVEKPVTPKPLIIDIIK
ncbi:MAG TPA: pyrimidine-nucleoside phosphorylase [Bacilli bacterium]